MKLTTILLPFLCMAFCLTSCRIYSTGHTQIGLTEKIEIYPLENSRAKVKIQNFSASDVYILKNSDKITLHSKNVKKLKLNSGDQLVVFHQNSIPSEIQVRCYMLFKNRVKVTRGNINN